MGKKNKIESNNLNLKCTFELYFFRYFICETCVYVTESTKKSGMSYVRDGDARDWFFACENAWTRQTFGLNDAQRPCISPLSDDNKNKTTPLSSFLS